MPASLQPTILRVDASARRSGSHSRALVDRVIAQLREERPEARVVVRDLADGDIPAVDEAWVTANNTPEAERSGAHRATLSISDQLVAELIGADTLVIGAPVYNFTVPASLKAWIDQICRARVTFAYSESGPRGLLTGKRAIVVYVSGGTSANSDIDFTSGYLRHILGFIGITDVDFIVADRLMFEGEAKLVQARDAIARLRPARSSAAPA